MNDLDRQLTNRQTEIERLLPVGSTKRITWVEDDREYSDEVVVKDHRPTGIIFDSPTATLPFLIEHRDLVTVGCRRVGPTRAGRSPSRVEVDDAPHRNALAALDGFGLPYATAGVVDDDGVVATASCPVCGFVAKATTHKAASRVYGEHYEAAVDAEPSTIALSPITD